MDSRIQLVTLWSRKFFDVNCSGFYLNFFGIAVSIGWQCDNVRASYNEISQAVQNEVYAGAKAFVKANKGRYECGGYIYTGEGQDIGQFWAKLAVGNATLKKTSSNASVTDGNGLYSIAGATYGVYSDKDCTKQLATLTTDNSGNTDTVEVKAGTVYIKELSAPAGYKVDNTVYSLNVEAGKTATLNVSDTPKVTDTLIELFKIDMETQKDAPQGDASLEGAEFTWKFYAGHYTADNLPSEPTKTWVTKTIAEKDSDGTVHYVSRLSDEYKVSGDIHSLIRDKFFVPVADPVIGSIVFKNVSGKDWLCFVSGDSGRGDRVGSFNVAVAMIHGNDFCVSDFSHKNPSCFCIDFLSSSYLYSTGLLWDKHTKIRRGRH